MSNQTMTFTGTLVVTDCWCGMRYAIPKTLHDFVHGQFEDGRPQTDIFCPLGHKWTFAGESAVAKERRRVERLERQLACRDEDLRAERASHSATKGQMTKLKNRAKAGVCPCCKRSFVQLARHMESQHPEFDPDAT